MYCGVVLVLGMDCKCRGHKANVVNVVLNHPMLVLLEVMK